MGEKLQVCVQASQKLVVREMTSHVPRPSSHTISLVIILRANYEGEERGYTSAQLMRCANKMNCCAGGVGK